VNQVDRAATSLLRVVAPDTSQHVVSGWGRVVAVLDGVGLAELNEFVFGLCAEDLAAAVTGQVESHGDWSYYFPRSWLNRTGVSGDLSV
jgi:hypothetical protein